MPYLSTGQIISFNTLRRTKIMSYNYASKSCHDKKSRTEDILNYQDILDEIKTSKKYDQNDDDDVESIMGRGKTKKQPEDYLRDDKRNKPQKKPKKSNHLSIKYNIVNGLYTNNFDVDDEEFSKSSYGNTYVTTVLLDTIDDKNQRKNIPKFKFVNFKNPEVTKKKNIMPHSFQLPRTTEYLDSFFNHFEGVVWSSKEAYEQCNILPRLPNIESFVRVEKKKFTHLTDESSYPHMVSTHFHTRGLFVNAIFDVDKNNSPLPDAYERIENKIYLKKNTIVATFGGTLSITDPTPFEEPLLKYDNPPEFLTNFKNNEPIFKLTDRYAFDTSSFTTKTSKHGYVSKTGDKVSTFARVYVSLTDVTRSLIHTHTNVYINCNIYVSQSRIKLFTILKPDRITPKSKE